MNHFTKDRFGRMLLKTLAAALMVSFLFISGCGLFDDDDDDNNTTTNGASDATSVAAGIPKSDTIEGEKDSDWFSFYAGEGIVYSIEVAYSSLTDARLAIYSTDGVTLIDEVSGANVTSQSETVLTNGTNYSAADTTL